jgi:2-polyprenyl-6-methoxyphenol hydroxylase-like FAD-dependent oxidoreductase
VARVVIVGAGPAGAALALLLAQRGISVTWVEAARNFQRSFRGEGLMPSGWEALRQLGLLPMLEQIPHRPLDAWQFFINGRPLFRVAEPFEPGGVPCQLVSQPALLEAMVSRACYWPNLEWLPGVAVQTLQTSPQGRVCGVGLSNGQSRPADLVIGADGRHSLVRQQAGLTLVAQPRHAQFDILWFKLADAPPFSPENVFYSVLRDRDAFGLFRSAENHWQIGWAWRPDPTAEQPSDWKTMPWAEKLASASPPTLAEWFRQAAPRLERPVLLTVVVGRCTQWFAPGVLLLGDAAHPMSPIRAQGINMALRDAIVAANYLVPILRVAEAGNSEAIAAAIDAALAAIQAEREPDIIRVQALQAMEAAQADLLANQPLLRWGVSQFSPLIGSGVKRSWLRRQRQLRQGATPVQLNV